MKTKVPGLPLWALAGLGLSQIIGYGTLYYAFSVLVPDIARDLGVSQAWVFGAFSAALLIGGFAAPISGRLADRIGAGRLMALGSLGAALMLVATAFAPGAWSFAAGLAAIEVVSAAVLYPSAFTAIVQLSGPGARTFIVHLTLIAGFASSLFWPFTSWLHQALSWREIFLVFAGLHLIACFPVHLALGRMARWSAPPEPVQDVQESALPDIGAAGAGNLVFSLMLLGFAIEGLALSAVLVHMVPLTQALGLGTAGLLVASLFGPAQVLSRLINLFFGKGLSQAWLAVIASALLPVGLAVLLASNPSLPGAVLFAICVGLGSGLTSIVSGTLPLELFGRDGYGSRLGWCTLAKQITSSCAPLAMSASLSQYGPIDSVTIVLGVGIAGLLAFLGVVWANAGKLRTLGAGQSGLAG